VSYNSKLGPASTPLGPSSAIRKSIDEPKASGIFYLFESSRPLYTCGLLPLASTSLPQFITQNIYNAIPLDVNQMLCKWTRGVSSTSWSEITLSSGHSDGSGLRAGFEQSSRTVCDHLCPHTSGNVSIIANFTLFHIQSKQISPCLLYNVGLLPKTTQ
jgi:hypothetical protein